MRRQILVGIVLFIASVASAQTNGPLGNPSSWHVHGLTELSPEAVKRRLSQDFEVLLVSHPRGPRDALGEVLETRTLELFHSNGFPQAEVTVRVDEGLEQIDIWVEEGPRCISNRIIVEGVNADVAEEIKAQLKQDSSGQQEGQADLETQERLLTWNRRKTDLGDGDKTALWSEGEYVSSSRLSLRRIRRSVATVMAAHGYRAPVFACRIEPAGEIADLVIHFSDLGRPAIVQQIQVRGNQQNSSEDIIRFLEIGTGDLVTEQKRREMEDALSKSGRFEKYEIAIENQEGGIGLIISVKEAKGLPGLWDALSREQKAVLKMADWVMDEDGSLRDFVIQYRYDTWKGVFVVSQSGVFVDLVHHSPANDHDFHLAVAATTSGLYLWDTVTQRKLSLQRFFGKLNLELGTFFDAAASEKPYRTVFGVGVQSNFNGATKSKVPVSINVDLEPVVMLQAWGYESPSSKWDGDYLELTSKLGSVLRIHEKTGDFSHRISVDGGGAEIRVLSGYLDDRLKQLSRDTESYDECFDASTPLTSIAGFIRNTSWPEGALEAVNTSRIGKFLAFCDDRILRYLDARIFPKQDQSEEDDEKGATERLVLESSLPLSNPIETMPRMLIVAADEMFPRNSWAWSVFREINFQVAGQGNLTNRELQFVLTHPSTGPIACWAISELLLVAQQPQMAAAVARMGQARMTAAAFRADCEALVEKQFYQFLPLAKVFLQLDDGQKQAIADLLSVDRMLLEDLATLCNEAFPAKSLEENVTPGAALEVLERLWERQLEKKVGVRLSNLSTAKTQLNR